MFVWARQCIEMRIKWLFILFHFLDVLLTCVLFRINCESHCCRRRCCHHHANVMKIVIAFVVCRCYSHMFTSNSLPSHSAAGPTRSYSNYGVPSHSSISGENLCVRCGSARARLRVIAVAISAQNAKRSPTFYPPPPPTTIPIF